MKVEGSLIDLDFQVEPYATEAFKLKSFFITSDSESALIDPIIEPELYDELIQETETHLKYIFLTHTPLHHVSNYEEIAKTTGATIVFGEGVKKHSNKNGTEFKLGKVTIKLISTPSYTRDSTSFLVINSKGKQRALFSGRILPLGGICKPVITGGEDKSKRIKDLFDSLNIIKNLEKDITIFPGFLSDNGLHSVLLSKELTSNQYLKCESLKDFEKLITCQEETELDREIKKVNEENTNINYLYTYKKLKKYKIDELKDILEKDKSIYAVDTREIGVSSKSFVKSSILIPFVMFMKFFPYLLRRESKIIIICEENKGEEISLLGIRLGFYGIQGYVSFTPEQLKESSIPKDEITYEPTTKEQIGDIKKKLENIFDVREVCEYEETGIVVGSVCIPLTTLKSNLKKIANRNIHIMCKSGGRASIAASFLKRNGYDKKICVFDGGMIKLQETGFSLTKYHK